MEECCSTCKYRLKLVMFDYSHGGCKHHDMGHACVANENEGYIAYMVGIDAAKGKCECYVQKALEEGTEA